MGRCPNKVFPGLVVCEEHADKTALAILAKRAMKKPKKQFLLFDISNGGGADLENAAVLYFWSFTSLRSARNHLKFQNDKRRKLAKLSGPFTLSNKNPESYNGAYLKLVKV